MIDWGEYIDIRIRLKGFSSEGIFKLIKFWLSAYHFGFRAGAADERKKQPGSGPMDGPMIPPFHLED